MAERRATDPIKEATRQSKAQRRVGEGACCTICGEQRPEAIVQKNIPIRCYQCAAKARGRSGYEAHHIAGRHNGQATLEIPANDHRAELSVRQFGWPKATLQNSEHSPLLAGAASLRGASDVIVYLITEFVEWIAIMLELLDLWLHEKLGAHWWRETPIQQWEPS